jgi:hypothetical protein
MACRTQIDATLWASAAASPERAANDAEVDEEEQDEADEDEEADEDKDEDEDADGVGVSLRTESSRLPPTPSRTRSRKIAAAAGCRYISSWVSKARMLASASGRDGDDRTSAV